MVSVSLSWLSQCQELANTWYGVPGTECYQGARERGSSPRMSLWLLVSTVQYAGLSWGSSSLIPKPCPQKCHFCVLPRMQAGKQDTHGLRPQEAGSPVGEGYGQTSVPNKNT